MTDYSELNSRLEALTTGVPHRIANLANAAALLWQEVDRINWAGFYIAEGEMLVLGPIQGKPACNEIPFGQGVCGTAAERRETIVVPKVHDFPGHIACDCASESEIVIPICCDGGVFGVLDIDSPEPDRFTESDKAGLEQFAGIIERMLEAAGNRKSTR